MTVTVCNYQIIVYRRTRNSNTAGYILMLDIIILKHEPKLHTFTTNHTIHLHQATPSPSSQMPPLTMLSAHRTHFSSFLYTLSLKIAPTPSSQSLQSSRNRKQLDKNEIASYLKRKAP